MNTELDIRLKAFNRSIGVLDLDENLAIWKGKPPEIFTTKEGEAVAMLAALEDAVKRQETGTGGATDEKDREETELEDVAFIAAQALMNWFNDTRQETEAGEMAMAKSTWQGLRDQQLLGKSQRVIDLAEAVVGGQQAAMAAKYGITADAVAALKKERKDYDDIVNAPGVLQAVRKALTKGLRSAFNLVERKFSELDGLIVQFGATETGKAMIAAWKNARRQKGANAEPAPEKKPATGGTPPATPK